MWLGGGIVTFCAFDSHPISTQNELGDLKGLLCKGLFSSKYNISWKKKAILHRNILSWHLGWDPLQFQFSSVTQSCPTLCDPMNCSMPGLPVHHQLLELTQTHVHSVGDAIQPSHPLSSSPLALNLSQPQGLFNELALHIRWPKYWSFSFNLNPSNEHPIPSSVQSMSSLTLCDPMNCSMPGLPVHHQLLEFTQTHVHWDATQRGTLAFWILQFAFNSFSSSKQTDYKSLSPYTKLQVEE